MIYIYIYPWIDGHIMFYSHSIECNTRVWPLKAPLRPWSSSAFSWSSRPVPQEARARHLLLDQREQELATLLKLSGSLRSKSKARDPTGKPHRMNLTDESAGVEGMRV